MKKIISVLILFMSSAVHGAYLFRNSASNINTGILNPLRVSPDTFTLRGNQWSIDMDASTTTALIRSNTIGVDTTTLLNTINNLPAQNESTSTVTLFGGGIFMSTSAPISSTIFRVTKATWTIAGVDAWAGYASTVAATKFKVWRSTDPTYSNSWSTVTPQIVLSTAPGAGGGSPPNSLNTYSNYISTSYVINDGWYVGIGIDTVPISGILTQDWGVNIYTIIRRNGQVW